MALRNKIFILLFFRVFLAEPCFAQVPPGNALHFDGTNDFVSIPHNALLKPASQITIEAWVMATNIHTNIYYEIYRKEDGNARHLLSFQDNGSILSFGVGTGLGYAELDVAIVASHYEGRWVHIAATYDGVTMKLYRNGEQIGHRAIAGPILTAGTEPAIIGASSGLSEFFVGSIDELRIWNTARSQVQIRNAMRDTIAGNTTGLVAYYRFESGIAGGNNIGQTTLTDQSPNGLNGTLNNFTLQSTTSNWLESYAMVVPSILPASNTSSNGFTANWSAPLVGTVNNYLLYVATDPGFNSIVAGYNGINVPVSTTSYTITNLPAAPVYYYRVCANKTTLSPGSFSSIAVVQLPPAPPVLTVPDIVAIEHYIDTDPGTGNATPLSATVGPVVQDAVIGINPASLTDGVHRLYVRAKNANGVWGLVNTHLFYKPYANNIVPPPGNITEITRVEYYLDTDPGTGNATTLNVSPGTDLQDIVIPIDPGSLSEGVHRLYIRAKNGNSNWSMVNTHIFVKPYNNNIPPVPGPISDITRVEYYVDTDPGMGNAIALPFTPGTDVQDIVIGIDPGPLSEGVHRLHVRARNANGNWTLVNTQLFAKPYNSSIPPIPTPATDIVRIEYFVDSDPGLGNATSIAITPGTDIQDAVISIDPATLTEGVHRLYIRSKNAAGNWSMVNTHIFYKPYAGTTPPPPVEPVNIVGWEYYIDTDPGKGNGIAIEFTPSTNVADIELPVNISALQLGSHTVYFRALDEMGRWSMVSSKTFNKQPQSALFASIGTVPDTICAGTTLSVPFVLNAPFDTNNTFTLQLSNANGSFASPIAIGTLAAYNSGSINATIPTNTATGSNYRLRLLSTAPLDTSDMNELPIRILRKPGNAFSINGDNTVCFGNQVYTSSNPENGVIYTWQLSGGGTIVPAGNSATVTWNAVGVHTITLTTSTYCGTGFTANRQVTVTDLSPSQAPVITSAGRVLSVQTTLPGASYQWFRNGSPISGATSTSYNATLGGSYFAVYSNSCGQSPASNIISFTLDAVSQTINFPAIQNKTYGDPYFIVPVSSSSLLPVTLSVTGGNATVSVDTIRITGAGNVTIKANQAGDTLYSAATTVTRTFTVNKATQTLTFDSLPDRSYGQGPYALAASSSSGLPVSFSSVSGPVTVSGGNVTIAGAGTATIKARQGGNQNYLAAEVFRTFCIYPRAADSIAGFVNTCLSDQVYRVLQPVTGTIYTWSLSGGGTLANSTGNQTTITWNEIGTHTIYVQTSAGCGPVSYLDSLIVNVAAPQVPGAVVLNQPVNGAIVNTYPITLFWTQATNASLYDLFIWKDGTAEPTTPLVANIAQVGYLVNQNQLPGFAPAVTYKWKVVARNACSQSSSTVNTFTISPLPNLVVNNITTPVSVFSGQQADINIEVKNTGQASTGNKHWVDGVYLSADTVLNKIIDQYVGGSQNISALGAGESYSNTIHLTLPVNVSGDYYVIVETDSYSQLVETSNADNTKNKAFPITLTPPPDLQVTSVVTPGDVFSAQQVNVAFTVQNKGQNAITNKSWTDAIYISPDPVFDVNGAILLRTSGNTGSLQPDSSYSKILQVTIPAQTFGVYYIYVVTDVNNGIYESTFENNNSRISDPINVFLTPPPDLVITQANVPDVAVNNEVVIFNWTVQNQGATKPPAVNWSDAIYLSAEPVFNAAAIRIGQVSAPAGANNLVAEATYNQSVATTIPATFVGRGYIFIVTDYTDKVFEYQAEGNNTWRDSINIVRPDLVVSNVGSPSTIASGTSMSVQFTIRNQGQGKVLASRQRLDKIWLSDNSNFSIGNKVSLVNISNYTLIDTAASQTLQRSITLPNGISGNYYLFVETDVNHNFPEENENNNLSVATPLSVSLSPSPDLFVDTVLLSTAMLNPGQKIGVHYKVTNKGQGDIVGKTWKDKIYISRYTPYGSGTSYLLKSVERVQTLLHDGSYEVTDSVEISPSILQAFQQFATSCYFYIYTDADNSIYEFNAENNNIRTGVVGTQGGGGGGGGGSDTTVVVVQQWPPDLGVTSVSALPADTVYSGSQAGVNWSVINYAYTTSYYSGIWYDGVYLSQDTVWSDDDLFITDKIVSGPLERDSTYQQQLNFTVPNGLSGNYYMLLVVDHKDHQHETIRGNNYKLIRDGAGVPKPWYIKLTPSPDLVISLVDAPLTGVTGQPVKFAWKTQNAGVGPTTAGAWSDRLYLSTNTTVGNGDHILANFSRQGNLIAGDSYTDSVTAFLPSNAEGSYYLLMKTDNNNIVYEHNAENNNTVVSPIFILRPDPADLVATAVTIPSQALVGDTVTVSYTLKNVGENPASGYVRNGIYLSSDTLLQVEDQLMANPQQQVNLLPGQEVSFVSSFKMNGITPANYHVIIKADLLNNIVETLEENNNYVSPGTLQVAVRELSMNIVTPGTLVNNTEMYYRLEIPDSLDGETMLLTLKGDSISGNNELYMRYGEVPTRVVYDFAFDRPLSGNQEIVIPAMKAGTYYILVYGAVAGGSQQSVTLLAKKIGFEIHSITAREGGNTGAMTVKLKGAKFENGMTASLVDNGGASVYAQNVYFINSTTAYATFNLGGKPTGLYDVKLTKSGGANAVLNDAFTVTQGSGGGVLGGGSNGSGGFFCTITNVGIESLLGIDLQYPEATRTRRAFPMTINFGNSGNVDIPTPTRVLISVNGDPISFTAEGLEENKTELYIDFKEANGPPNILRPGASGSIIIYTRSIARKPLVFRLYE